MNILQNTQDSKRKLIGQGTYGCIIKPAYTKQKKGNQSKVSKIGLMDDVNENEAKMGEKIKNISNYKSFFSPLLQSNELFLHSTKQVETQECHLVLNNEKKNPVPEKTEGNKYIVHTMNYVGKYNLEEHFIELLKTKSGRYIQSHLLQCHNHLLKALVELKKANIIHFDLYSGNVMVSDKRHLPILIDFGLSFDAPEKGVSLKKSNTPFFTYSTDFNPWCIDIIVITYYIHKKKHFLHEATVNSKELLVLLKDQIQSNNSIFSRYMSEAQKETYEANITAYFKSWDGKSAMDMYHDLYKKRYTWDNYSIAVLMLKLVKNMELYNVPMNTYTDLLIKTIITAPNERMDAETLQTELMKLQSQTSQLHDQRVLSMKNKSYLSNIIKNIHGSIHGAKSEYKQLRK